MSRLQPAKYGAILPLSPYTAARIIAIQPIERQIFSCFLNLNDWPAFLLSFFFPLAEPGALADERETLMRDLSARMRSRGPDGSGYHGNEKFGLAHERLAIMDPEGGKQPIVYEDAKYSVCANGEIYNFRQLQVFMSIFRCISGSTLYSIDTIYSIHVAVIYFARKNIN